MSGHEHWQLDGSAPELYQRYLVPAITSIWAADLIDRVQPKRGEAVLDVACGTGVVTRLAAERVTTGRVIGLDLNEGMLTGARSVPHTGVPIEWLQGSALALPVNDGAIDLVLCQLGLQFFPDRACAVREMKRVLASSGRVALSVYSAIERTPGAEAFASALDERLGPDASKIKRAEHIFADANEVGDLLRKEGLDDVELYTVTKTISFPSVLDYVRFQLIATPMAGLLADRQASERDSVIEAVASATRLRLDPSMMVDGRFSFPQEAHIAIASKL
ncbi:class I SAM-dependent methyltransferase [Mesorhizobium sp.]|uniref:class I SAM-dependent methyltransferase n=1 Tax=Mesorhizobium sp. TaxID=1871066 RepID=UPI0007EC612F|nr:class I SAM-dependent methyltransferase [Mesorhizobium sp.]RWD31739.1 MAG: methyltransferase domain-containing protein [Mesorhizobium sp.]RWD77615.1 MAG: methyltransferase domain-containing protein [Mesorhizobium sp.]RWF50406.1 MAG: methyltransferase domain-containing protein [Mesorhizobium sp.]TIS42317.1 MAG: methyltransferase domain-containing protein [Mesorhizobium sp.]TIX81770.1 MAG: methyltransferase domain-containing protein [Mesorhizobium sp.]